MSVPSRFVSEESSGCPWETMSPGACWPGSITGQRSWKKSGTTPFAVGQDKRLAVRT